MKTSFEASSSGREAAWSLESGFREWAVLSIVRVIPSLTSSAVVSGSMADGDMTERLTDKTIKAQRAQ